MKRPPSFLCPITAELLRDPVVCADGHSYERDAITRWLLTHATSPMTGAPLAHDTLVPNHSLRQSIQEFEEAHYQQWIVLAVLDGAQDIVAMQLFPRTGLAALAPVELRVLLAASRNPHVLRFYGHCITNGSEETTEEFVLMEYAPFGNMLALLEKTEETQDGDNGGVSMAHKWVVLRQLVAGMKALGHEGIVHRDLSLRHVMVSSFEPAAPEKTVVKISGYALRLAFSRAFRAGWPEAPPPVRWMARESILKRRFDTRSDVWSFGVTAWELLAHGEVPFAVVMDESEVARRVCNGERLQQPENCSDALWQVVKRRWAKDPKDRPTFAQLEDLLTAGEEEEKRELASSWVWVKTLTGDTFKVDLDRLTSVASLKGRIEEVRGTPAYQQRLLFNGRQWEDERQLTFYQIKKRGDTIYLVERVRGDIGLFVNAPEASARASLQDSADDSTTTPQQSTELLLQAGSTFLSSTKVSRSGATPAVVRAIVQDAVRRGPSMHHRHGGHGRVVDQQQSRVLTEEMCDALVELVEAAWHSASNKGNNDDDDDSNSPTAPLFALDAEALLSPRAKGVHKESRRGDYRLVISAARLERVVGTPQIMAQLLRVLHGDEAAKDDDDDVVLVLRRTVASGRWIEWHTDNWARTVQVPLQSDHSGADGRLVYALADGTLQWPERRAGCALAHDGSVVHGVTRFIDGLRYGLYVLRGRRHGSSPSSLAV